MGSTTRRVGALVAAAAAVLVTLAPMQADARLAEPRGPVAADDHLVISTVQDDIDVDVLDNDSTPGGGWLQVCRVDAPDDIGLRAHIWSHDGWPGFDRIHSGSTYLSLEPERELTPGTYEIRYYACSHRLLAPATLTVEVREITAEAVPGRPHVVRFTNPLDEAIEILFGPEGRDNPGGDLRLGAHQSHDQRVRHDDISWAALLSSDLDEEEPFPVGWGVVHLGEAAPARPHAVRRAHRAHRADEPDLQAPVTAPDRVVLDYYDSADVDVLANDSDADNPADLGVCWADVPVDVGLDALAVPWWSTPHRARSDSPERYLEVGANAAKPGSTFTITYYACDRRHLTPGTLTVKIRDFPRPGAERVPGHPGDVRFHNFGYRTVDIEYFRGGHYTGRYHLFVPPHRSSTVHVGYDTMRWSADTSIGPLASGVVRDVQQDG